MHTICIQPARSFVTVPVVSTLKADASITKFLPLFLRVLHGEGHAHRLHPARAPSKEEQ